MGFKTKFIVAALAALMLGTGCTKSSSSNSDNPSSSALTISGSLAIEGSTSSVSGFQASGKLTKASNSKFAVSDYKIACATFENTPKSCGGDVDSTGAFSVSCTGFSGVPFGCFVYHKTTYANYPITFNVNSGDDQSTVSVSGNVTATVNLDLETGTATAAATVAEGTETEISVDYTKVSNLDGVYSMAGAPYAQVSSKYTSEQLEFFKFIPCMMNNNNNSEPDLTQCLNGSPETGYNMMAQEMGGGGVELFASTDSSTTYLSAWDSGGARAACGNVETGFTWKISDGDSGNGMADVTFNLSGTDQSSLKTAVGSSVSSIISTYFPFLADGSSSSTAFAASCKFAGDLNGDFWNSTPEQVAACQADNTCFNGFGDAFGALQRYKFKKLWSEYAGTDAILGTVDYTGKLVNESGATLKYGYRAWDPNTNQPTIQEIAGINSSNVDDYRVDVGGCLQWPNWSDTSSTASKVATVVPVGEYVTWYTPNGEMKDKCRMSEKRLLYEDNTNGYIQIGTSKYKDINVFVDMGGGDFKETWNKVCQVGADGNSNGSIDDVNAPTTDIMMYPVDFDSTKIATEAQNRFNGGNPEQRKGIKLDAIYTMLTENHGGGGSGGNQTFWYWDMATNSGGQISCNDIKAPPSNTTSSVVWAKVEKAIQNTFDPWSLKGLLSCAMIGVANGEYDGDQANPASDANDDMDGSNAAKQPKTLAADYKDLNSNGLPDIVDDLKSNSCIPKFQMTSICSDDGYCESRVVCNSMTAANGGCDQAEPAGRFAKMKAEGLGSDKFRFFNRDERFENFFDPSSNKSKQCTRGESMTITTEDAISSPLSTSGVVRLAFGRVESKVCDGETAEVMAFPPMFMDFTKQ